jgi:hypothetical protein
LKRDHKANIPHFNSIEYFREFNQLIADGVIKTGGRSALIQLRRYVLVNVAVDMETDDANNVEQMKIIIKENNL